MTTRVRLPRVDMTPRLAVGMVALAASSWGLWSLFLRPTGLPGTVTSALMLGFVGLFALPLALREAPARWDRRAVALLGAMALADAVNMLTFFAAMDHATVAVAVLTHYFAPVLVAVAAPAVDRTWTRGAPAAAGVATLGLALVLEPWRADATDGLWLGALLGTTSATAYASYVFLVRRLVPRIGPGRAMSYHALLAALLLVPFAASGDAALTAEGVALVGAGSLFLGAVAGVAFVVGVPKIGSAKASVLTFAEPLVAMSVGWVAFGEALSPWAALGASLIIGAGVYVARAPTRSLVPVAAG